MAAKEADPLTRWAADHLASTPDRSLPAMLEAAMRRSYSASPWEGFFTGRRRPPLRQLQPEHNGRTLSVAEAFRHSVNLVFVRLMRDIVRYFSAVDRAFARELLEDRAHPARAAYLARFADREGSTFLNQFYGELRRPWPRRGARAARERSAAPRRAPRGDPPLGPARGRPRDLRRLPAEPSARRERTRGRSPLRRLRRSTASLWPIAPTSRACIP